MIRLLVAIAWRDIRLAMGRGGDALYVLGFFIVTAALFPLAVGAGEEILRALAVGIIWVTMLLASLLALPGLYQKDEEDGTLEQYLLLPLSAEWLVLAKWLAHWATSALPLIVCAPPLALMLHMENEAQMPLLLSLLLGSVGFTAVGSLGAALTIGIRQGWMLLGIIVLPLYVPVLIFGCAAARPGAQIGMAGSLLLLGGYAALLLPLSCLASAYLLRHGRE